MTRLPLNIAHRGLPVEAPENTIEGARLAYENGADVIELDIYLTTDNKLVVIHDSTTQRTCNVNVTVENCSLSELQEIYVNKGFENDDRFNKCKIPTFEQYLQEFKDKNVRLFVEVKSNNADIVSYARDLIEKYDMYSQISFISFDSNQLAKINECYPGSTTGLLLDQAPSSTSIHEDIVKAQKVLGSTFSTLNPRMDGYSKTAIQAALARGISIYPWTFNTQKEYLTYFYNGYSGLTGNDCRKLGQYPKSIETKYSDKEYFIGDTLNVEAEVINYDKTYNKNASIKIKSLDENADEQNQIILSKTGKKSFILCCETYINDFESYIIYSDVITIDVKEKDTSGVKNFGCQGSIVTSTGIVSLSSMLGSFIALKKKKQKIQKQ